MLAQVHPRDDDCILVCPLLSLPVLVRVSRPEDQPREVTLAEEDKPTKVGKTTQGVVAVFGPRGERIYAGTPRGLLRATNESHPLMRRPFARRRAISCR